MSRRKDWGDVFRAYLAKGMDHADAAYRADEWDRRRPADDANTVQAKPYMDICEQLSSQLAAAQARIAELEAYQAIVFDGYRVLEGLTDKQRQFVSAEAISAVLDTIERLARGAREGE